MKDLSIYEALKCFLAVWAYEVGGKPVALGSLVIRDQLLNDAFRAYWTGEQYGEANLLLQTGSIQFSLLYRLVGIHA